MAVKQTEQPMSSTPAGMRRSVSASIAGKAAEILTLALLATVVPRVLGPADYGRFSVPLTIVTLGSLAMTLGGPTLMARYVPAAPAGERVALATAIGARLAVGRSAQLGGLAVLGAGLVAWNADAFPPVDTGLVFLALALNVGATLALQVGLGLGRTVAWSIRYPIQNAALIATVLLLHESAGSTGGVVAIAIAGAAGAAFAAAVVVPIVRPPSPRVPVPDGAIRFGVHQAAGAALMQFCHRGGVLVVAILGTSATETGYVALATGIALGATYAVLQMFTVSLTHLSATDGTPGEPVAGAESVLRRLAWMVWAVLAVGGLAGAVVIDEVIPVLFGDGYEDAAAAFGPAFGLLVLAPLYSLTVQSAALRYRPEAATASGVAAVVVFLTVSAATVPAWGAEGGTSAALAGAAAGGLVGMRMLPGAVGTRLGGASYAAAAVVAIVAVLA
ncbi:MAG: hypothetical protein U5K30_14200 [Acidimicrobiales bacterium]|nr:hypothetical protein [Acidimicrobiales bacterium]